MKPRIILPMAILAMATLFGAGCADSVPENTPPADGSNPRVGGSPEDRIKGIEANPTLTPQEKEQRIKAVKDRNHLN